MSVFRRGKVYWYEFNFNGARIRESAHTLSKTIAKQAEMQRRRELELGINRISQPKRMPLFRVAAERLLEDKRARRAKNTAELYRFALKPVTEEFGPRLVSDITPEDIAAYQAKRLRDGMAARTVNLEVGALRVTLKAYRLWGAIADGVEMLRERRDVGRAISREDEEKLTNAIRQSRSPALFPLFAISLDSGLRAAEVRGLHRRDLHLTWRDGAVESGVLTVSQSKTEAGTGRSIPLTRRACAALTLWLSRFPDADSDSYVFPRHAIGMLGNNRTAHLYSVDLAQPIGQWKKAWKDACRLAMVTYRWHDLRHTFITRLAENSSVSEQTIMSLAGHVSRSMLQRYSHIRNQAKQAAIATLEVSPHSSVFDGDSPQKSPHSAPDAEAVLN
jgi:integrase